MTVTHNGRKVDVVAHAGKTGFLYVFNRVTGEPLWPIEERAVEKSDVPLEQSWPTQPFPTKPPPFVRQSFTEDDVNPWLLTPEEYEALRERVRKAKNGTGPQGGLFNPTVLNGDSISMPGNQGGSNWGTAAANPQRGLVFVTGVNQVALLRVTDVKDPAAAQRARRRRQSNRRRRRDAGPARLHAGTASPATAPIREVPFRACRRSSASPIASTKKACASSCPRDVTTCGRSSTCPPKRFAQSTRTCRSPIPPAGAGAEGVDAAAARGLPLPPGPVVASGGVPRPPLPPRYGGPFYPGVGGTAGNMPWPEDVAAAKLPTRYQSGYNVMATATKPPYTTITAYDLNTGEIKWQVPNGDDPATVNLFGKSEGPHDTGGVGARNGMLVTRRGCSSRTARTAGRAPTMSTPARSCGRAKPQASRSASP